MFEKESNLFIHLNFFVPSIKIAKLILFIIAPRDRSPRFPSTNTPLTHTVSIQNLLLLLNYEFAQKYKFNFL